ncbi:FlaA1/EpsC-like NDP-sugar epimerase [Devosia sp. UYZn731]
MRMGPPNGLSVPKLVEPIQNMVGSLPRFWKRVLLVGYDLCALAAALCAAYALRYGGWLPPTRLDQFMLIASAPVIAIPIFIRAGLYRAIIRFLPVQALWTILQAMSIAVVCWVVVVFLSEMAGSGTVPRSVPFLYWAFGIVFIAGSRFIAKALLWPSGNSASGSRPVAIYGAGEAGAQLAHTLRMQGQRMVVGFLDDKPQLHGRDVAGVRVFSPSHLPTLVERYGVTEVILSIPSLTTHRRQEIFAAVGGHGIKVRTVPHLFDIATGKYSISEVREIDIDELLGRSSIPSDPELFGQIIAGRSIMVTGAGGSIGSELCRLVTKWAPQRLVLFESNEFALYQIERELSTIKDLAIVPLLGSVTDQKRLAAAMLEHGTDVVFHAAAYKHVPLVEANPLEGIYNNVFGTRAIARAALEAGVMHFVLISTDKAVRPTNVMGATKRWAELIVNAVAREAAASGSGQKFCAVRFGNVLGSNGSVVPLFKEQIAAGGPLTLTDTAMTRYFMSIHEAAELIAQAGALSEGGDLFVLDMGEPVLIRTLAENMIRLAGLSVRGPGVPHGEIEIVVVGKRPGEKLYEELFYDETSTVTTSHLKIRRAPTADTGGQNILTMLDALEGVLEQRDEPQARRILFSVIADRS